MDANTATDTLRVARLEYTQGELPPESLREDPIEQFSHWFEQAVRAGVYQPDAMSLCTVSAAAQPSLRTVLMKSFDARGFVFYTNLHSRKSREIGENPRVALMFPWLTLERQVIISGVAERLSTAEAIRYFLTRPRGSRLAAWASRQSQTIASRRALEMEWERMARKFAAGEVPLPTFWGGYRVRPRTIEFWQGRVNRLHDRYLYTRQEDGSWTIERLAP